MVANDIIKSVNHIVNMVKVVTKGEIKIRWMTLYYKIDYMDRLFLMWASEFVLIPDEKGSRDEKLLKSRSKSRLVDWEVQRHQFSIPTTHFTIPMELRNFEAPAPNLGDGIRLRSRIISQCTRCGMKIPEYKLVAVKFSMLCEQIWKQDLATKKPAMYGLIKSGSVMEK